MSRHTHGGGSEESAGSADGRLPDSAVSDLIESDRRRHLLACLADVDGPVPVTDLARRVHARESETPVQDVGQEDAGAVRDDVYHEHLPKLTATEVVTFNSLVGTVRLATDDDRILEVAEGDTGGVDS